MADVTESLKKLVADNDEADEVAMDSQDLLRPGVNRSKKPDDEDAWDLPRGLNATPSTVQ